MKLRKCAGVILKYVRAAVRPIPSRALTVRIDDTVQAYPRPQPGRSSRETGQRTLDLDACTWLRLQHGWSRSYAPRLAVMRWYLLVLLTGEHPAIPGTRKPFSSYCTGFRYGAPGPLRAFLHQQAQASLAQHGITEPVTWEPPAHWVTWEDWPARHRPRQPLQ